MPGYKAGGPITSVVNIIENLKDFFEFYVVTSDTDYLETEPYKDIKSDEWINFSDNLFVFYFSKQKLSKQNITTLIKGLNFDIAYINGIYSYFFSILPLLVVKKMKKKIIISARGMLSEHAFSRKSLKKKVFLLYAKIKGFYKNVKFHATNYDEKTDILKITGNSNISVIPNLPRKIENITDFNKIKKENQLNLVSIARISQEKNTKYTFEILAQIKDFKINFDLFGSINDEVYWNECKKIIDNLPQNIQVSYFQAIESAKVIETFRKYHFSFMPSLGENFGHSILESFSAGTPVITSNNTPWKNLEEKNIGWDIDLNNKAKFIDVINKCVKMSSEDYNKMSKNCFIFASEFVKKQDLIEKTKKLFDE